MAIINCWGSSHRTYGGWEVLKSYQIILGSSSCLKDKLKFFRKVENLDCIMCHTSLCREIGILGNHKYFGKFEEVLIGHMEDGKF
jgi:hypothetical protein